MDASTSSGPNQFRSLTGGRVVANLNPIEVGQKHGMLTVVSYLGRDKRSNPQWECRCDCGGKVRTLTYQLQRTRTHCGCRTKANKYRPKTTHGLAHTREYRIWGLMISRCHNQDDSSYDRYGGRGITVCTEWRESFLAFYRDMGPRPSSKHSIDRIKNDQGYSKDNCRWATPVEQQRNTRRSHFLTHAGETLTIAAWSERLGLPPYILHDRIRYGWTTDRILTTPILQTWSRQPKKRS